MFDVLTHMFDVLDKVELSWGIDIRKTYLIEDYECIGLLYLKSSVVSYQQCYWCYLLEH